MRLSAFLTLTGTLCGLLMPCMLLAESRIHTTQICRWQTEKWVPKYRITNSYNPKGEKTESVTQTFHSNDWYNWEKLDHRYDSASKRTQSYWHMSVFGVWAVRGKATYTYDEKGNRTVALWQEMKDDKWSNHARQTYVYDDRNNEILQLIELWRQDKEEWGHSSKYEFWHDDDGRKVGCFGYKWGDNEDWQLQYQMSYEYDDDGNNIEELSLCLKDEQWENHGKTTHTYRNAGIRPSLQREFPLRWDSSISYDIFGRVVKGTVPGFDSMKSHSGGVYFTVTKYANGESVAAKTTMLR